MKKLILVITLGLSLSVTSQIKQSQNKPTTVESAYNDSKNGVSTVYNDLKSTAPQIKSALESLSKELKTTTESLWHILVKQQLVWSWCYLILMITSCCNWILFYRRNLGGNLKYDKVKVINQKFMFKEGTLEDNIRDYPYTHGSKVKNIEEEELQLVPNSTIPYFKYLHLAVCLILSVFSFIHFSDMLTGFINPEFGALKTITEVVKSIR